MMTLEEIDDILFGYGVDSFNRFQTFIDLIPNLHSTSYWYALRNSYEMSDNLYHYTAIVKNCFLRNEPHRESMMQPEELDYLKNLPEQITIYRGMTEIEFNQNSFGCSWTLDRKVAEFFANEYTRNINTNNLRKVVHEITINKNEVIAFFNARNEFEIIYISQ